MERRAEEAEFSGFVVARSLALMRTTYLLTQDHQLAEDLVQTALFQGGAAVAASGHNGWVCLPG